MSSWPYYDKGNWEAICDSCGRRYKASQLRLRWDGFMVCKDDWEPRQPQDFVRAKIDIQSVPWTRPEPTNTFVAISPVVWPGAVDVSLGYDYGTAIVDLAIVDVAIVGIASSLNPNN